MIAREWSLNALETETSLDRRTLAKRLAHLPATSVKVIGTRIERKWRLRDILPYLDAKPSEPTRSIEADTHEMMKVWVGTDLFPKLIETPAFLSLLTGHLVTELGLSKGQALATYQAAVMALVYGLCEGFADDDMQFNLPDDALTRKLGDKSIDELEAYAAEHWHA